MHFKYITEIMMDLHIIILFSSAAVTNVVCVKYGLYSFGIIEQSNPLELKVKIPWCRSKFGLYIIMKVIFTVFWF